VSLVGSASTSLGGRLGGLVNGTVDVFMDEDPDAGGSKMRFDDLLQDPRAQVLVAPPGTDPSEYGQRGPGGRRGRGGRGGRRGRGRRRGGSTMDLD